CARRVDYGELGAMDYW
nr:immunoglobulin heavy chain junction region [Mus musculus]MBK4184272.1 immunoglobulin heavy chain junction region [Mus musculus]